MDKIARVLDYPGYVQFEFEEKKREVEQLLCRQRVLLIMDNFETITDSSLLSWLLRLPEPSKALITSREYSRAFRSNTSVIDLRSMTEIEAAEYVQERLHFLKLENLIPSHEQLAPLLLVSGGNPKAIGMALGCIKYERRPLQDVIDDLYAARGDIFDDLFTRCWSLLDEAARRVLLSMIFFVASASTEALSVTADVKGLTFERAIERLIDMALLDVQQKNLSQLPSYVIHPLVRSFIKSKLDEQEGFEFTSLKRWIKWYEEYTSQVGFAYYNLEKLKMLDLEWNNIELALKLAVKNKLFEGAVDISKGCKYYLLVRGFLDKCMEVNLVHYNFTYNTNNQREKAEAIAHIISSLSLQYRLDEAQEYFSEMQKIVHNEELPIEIYFETQFALTIYHLISQDTEAVVNIWQGFPLIEAQLPPYAQVEKKHFLAMCYYNQGNFGEAQMILQDALQVATNCNYQREISLILLNIAIIQIELGLLKEAAETLSTVSSKIQYYQERPHFALLRYFYARLFAFENNLVAALTALSEAVELFERIGMRRELIRAQSELTTLKEVSSSSNEEELRSIFDNGKPWQFSWY